MTISRYLLTLLWTTAVFRGQYYCPQNSRHSLLMLIKINKVLVITWHGELPSNSKFSTLKTSSNEPGKIFSLLSRHSKHRYRNILFFYEKYFLAMCPRWGKKIVREMFYSYHYFDKLMIFLMSQMFTYIYLFIFCRSIY